jgi:predicted GNAT family acetyltransferase
VLFADDEPAAVAGVYDTAGLSEIGVDVAPEHRRRGLSPIVVSAACADLVAEAKTAFYECEVRNIASQHTALASGFLPACSVSTVMPAGIGLE